jgi:hypothetical protein
MSQNLTKTAFAIFALAAIITGTQMNLSTGRRKIMTMTDATNVLIIIDTVCILAITIKTFISKDGYRKGVEDGIKYSVTFLNKLFKDTIGYIDKDKKNSNE